MSATLRLRYSSGVGRAPRIAEKGAATSSICADMVVGREKELSAERGEGGQEAGMAIFKFATYPRALIGTLECYIGRLVYGRLLIGSGGAAAPSSWQLPFRMITSMHSLSIEKHRTTLEEYKREYNNFSKC